MEQERSSFLGERVRSLDREIKQNLRLKLSDFKLWSGLTLSSFKLWPGIKDYGERNEIIRKNFNGGEKILDAIYGASILVYDFTLTISIPIALGSGIYKGIETIL